MCEDLPVKLKYKFVWALLICDTTYLKGTQVWDISENFFGLRKPYMTLVNI